MSAEEGAAAAEALSAVPPVAENKRKKKKKRHKKKRKKKTFVEKINGPASDNWETPKEVYVSLAKRLRLRNDSGVKRIWDPFYCTGRSKAYLQAAFPNKRIIHRRKNFFKWRPRKYDVIITNPPYSKWKEVLPTLLKMGKPFAALINSPSLMSGMQQDAINSCPGDWRALWIKRRVKFFNLAGEQKNAARFPSFWIIKDMEIEPFVRHIKFK